MIRTAPLGQVADINPRSNLELDDDAEVSFIPMAAVDEAGGSYREEVRTYGEVRKGYTSFESGDVLLAKITPCMENGKVACLNGLRSKIGFGSTEFHVLRAGPELDRRYLFHMLWNPRFRYLAEKRMTGAGGQRRVPTAFLKEYEIPLPKKSEQVRIAAILDKADSIRCKRRQALAEIDALLRATFLDMFGDPRTNPKGFKTAALEDVCERIVDCLHTTPRHKDAETPYPSIRTSDLQNGFLDFSTTKYVEKEEYEERIVRHRPVAGDIIYSREGERLGIAAVIPEGLNLCLGQRTMLFSVNRKRTNPDFVWQWLNSKSTYELATSRIGGATSPHINIGDIRKFDIIQPPLDDQQKFSRICGKVIGKRDTILQFSKNAEQLFASLSQRAFRGELRCD